LHFSVFSAHLLSLISMFHLCWSSSLFAFFHDSSKISFSIWGVLKRWDVFWTASCEVWLVSLSLQSCNSIFPKGIAMSQ
jgi:hypothetical protein